MAEVIYQPVYVVNPRKGKGFVTEMNGEDFINVTQGKTTRIKHPVKTIDLPDHPTLENKFKGYETCIFVSSRFGFFLRKKDDLINIATKKAGKDIYEVFKCLFENLDYTIQNNEEVSIEHHL